MSYFDRVLLVVLISLANIGILNAQLAVNTGIGANQLAQMLVGGGVTITNAQLTVNDGRQAGTFSNGSATNIGIDAGVILSTGNAANAAGSPSQIPSSDYAGNCGNFLFPSPCPSNVPELAAIANETLHDAAVLEFDFIPTGPSITFNFVFASAEYPTYVNSYNDAFGIFLSGPGVSGPYNGSANIALVPGTTTPITINNVNAGTHCSGNGCSNCEYYVNNCYGSTIRYQGFTTPITANYNVQCGETYHIKFAIADASDAAYDSAVFIEEESLSSGVTITTEGTTICAGESITISAESFGDVTGDFLWSPGGETTSEITVNPYVTTEYVVTYTINNCPASDTIVIEVENCGCTPPELSISSISICGGQPANLDNAVTVISGGPTLTYHETELNAFHGSLPISNLVQETGTYWVRAEDLGDPDCFSLYQIDVTINEAPNYTLEPTMPSCGYTNGEIAILGLVPNSNYEVSYELNGSVVGPTILTADGNGTITFTGLSQGTYGAITILTEDGCLASGPSSVTLNPEGAPDVQVSDDVVICLGESVTISATSSTPGATITWSPTIDSGTPFTPTTAGVTVYTVTATIDGCSATDQVTVIVNDLPNVYAGPDLTICQGMTVTLSGSGALTYQWDNGVINNVPFIAPANNTSYTVVGTDENGCIGTDFMNLTVTDGPEPDFVGEELEGCSPLEVTFSKTTPGNNETCIWDLGDGNTVVSCSDFVHTYTESGQYTVKLTVIDEFGCQGEHVKVDYVNVTPSPIASFTVDNQDGTLDHTVVNFINSSTNATEYIWSFGDGSPISTEVNTTHTYPDDVGSTYYVTLVASNGEDQCNDTTQMVIRMREDQIAYVPNAFTPDNDNYNEVFKPIFTSGYDPYTYTMTIFNRWGEVIFESNDWDYGWDGTYGVGEGIPVPEGMYIWKITVKEIDDDKHTQMTGHVNVLR